MRKGRGRQEEPEEGREGRKRKRDEASEKVCHGARSGD